MPERRTLYRSSPLIPALRYAWEAKIKTTERTKRLEKNSFEEIAKSKVVYLEFRPSLASDSATLRYTTYEVGRPCQYAEALYENLGYCLISRELEGTSLVSKFQRDGWLVRYLVWLIPVLVCLLVVALCVVFVTIISTSRMSD